jgi:hypothetical protein
MPPRTRPLSTVAVDNCVDAARSQGRETRKLPEFVDLVKN